MRVSRFDGLVLIGAVRGPVAEAGPVTRELQECAPGEVILDVSPEELKGLQEHFASPSSEPLVPLAGSEAALAGALSRFGEVRMPSPAFVAAVRWARSAGADLLPLDVSDDSYTDMFLENVGYIDLVRRTRAERALVKGDGPEAADAEELAIRWAGRLHRGRGSARLWERRIEAAVSRLDELAPPGRLSPAAAIADVERWEGISRGLAALRGTPETA